MLENFYNFIIHPKTKVAFKEIIGSNVVFNDNSKLPIYNGIPMLLSENSIFKIEDILNKKITTQDGQFRNKKTLKNYVRTKILPALCDDKNIEKRYLKLSKLLSDGSCVLILGAGDKIEYYKNLFDKSQVITSDVHTEFKVDVVLDGHEIPFKNETFDLILAAQVLEHTLQPWIFASEIFRVAKTSGYIQIEAPQNYPYHGQPYDFFRFTFTGLRSLFPQCELVHTEITEGNASIVAVTNANFLVNKSSNKYYRQVALFLTRLLFGWMKYFDNLKLNKRTVSNPKGYAMTFVKDNKTRNSEDLFYAFYNLPK